MTHTALILCVAVLAVVTTADDLPPSCDRPVYCNSSLLHHVQLARLYPDSKTFVDMQLLKDPDSTLAEFDLLLNETNENPTREQLQTFVNEHFKEADELEEWFPPDFSDEPKFLNRVRDPVLRKYGKDINAIFPTLGRKVKTSVFETNDRHSLIPVTNGFIIPGGRFKELYYWDTYWIIEGLLVSGMKDTAKGVIENLIQLVKKLGHIPNGSRWYYQERSQPPLLTAMALLYYRHAKDVAFLKENIGNLELELAYWLDNRIVTFEKNGKTYTLLRYYAPSSGPRPESYAEDYTDARAFATEERRTEFYIDIKSAAESGWDFSTRWFVNRFGKNVGNLTTIHTREIIPVDLNVIFANALTNIAFFHAVLGEPRKSAHYAFLSRQWRNSIDEVFWNEEDGIWYDYDMDLQQPRRYFFPTNVSPLWMGVVSQRVARYRAPRILAYLRSTNSLEFPGGIPSSLVRSGQQWDFPNVWPPLMSIMVTGIDYLGTAEAKQLAFEVAQNWVRVCLKGYNETQQMYEKYDADVPGQVGGGGEYVVQTGFGWSNGVVLEFLAKYGGYMTAEA